MAGGRWRRRVRAAGVALALLGVAACQQEMADQPSYKPLHPSDFFADGRSARPLPEGTVARGHLRTDLALFTGKRNRPVPTPLRPQPEPGSAAARQAAAADVRDDNVDAFPFPVTRAVLEEGRERYLIYCVVCHDARGTGHGKIVERGYTPPPTYHSDRLRAAPVGHFFDVITNGYGSMPDYRQQVAPRQRWAIAAYIRALQLSQHFPEGELTPAMRRQWQVQREAGPAGGAAP